MLLFKKHCYYLLVIVMGLLHCSVIAQEDLKYFCSEKKRHHELKIDLLKSSVASIPFFFTLVPVINLEYEYLWKKHLSLGADLYI